jgi:hypothetical protein
MYCFAIIGNQYYDFALPTLKGDSEDNIRWCSKKAKELGVSEFRYGVHRAGYDGQKTGVYDSDGNFLRYEYD